MIPSTRQIRHLLRHYDARAFGLAIAALGGDERTRPWVTAALIHLRTSQLRNDFDQAHWPN